MAISFFFFETGISMFRMNLDDGRKRSANTLTGVKPHSGNRYTISFSIGIILQNTI